jgi:hypothetical protein
MMHTANILNMSSKGCGPSLEMDLPMFAPIWPLITLVILDWSHIAYCNIGPTCNIGLSVPIYTFQAVIFDQGPINPVAGQNNVHFLGY